MSGPVCPWWLGQLLAAPLRRLWQNPRTVLDPYLAQGMTALEPGPGMGFFTLEMARLVGPAGRVVAVDIQPRMLEGLRRRAMKAGLLDRIDVRLAQSDRMGLDDLQGQVDFVFAFAVVHELPDAARFFTEARGALKPGGRLLLAEPRLHVSAKAFTATLRTAERAGFSVQDQPDIALSRCALLTAG